MTYQYLRTIKQRHILILAIIIGCIPNAYSQSAPTASDVSSYVGLHSAANNGDIEAARILIQSGANLESLDGSGRTPLLVAGFASHEKIVKLLSDAGADMNAKENRAYDIVTIAAVANDLEMLNVALELGASAGNITSPYDGTALIAAAHLGHYEIVDSLIKGNAPLDHINNLNWTALIEAVVLGDGGENHTRTLELLLKAGADKTITDRHGVTPLEHAKSRGFQAMIDLLAD